MRRSYRSLVLITSLLLLLFLLAGASIVESRSRTGLLPGSAKALMSSLFPTNLPPVNIMPLGDSLTAGVTLDDSGGMSGGYRVPLWQECQWEGWNVHFVGSVSSGPASLPERNHEGHPGWRINQLTNYIVPQLKQYQPQIILLHIGTNDLRAGTSASVAHDRLVTLLNQITATLPKANVIVAQIIPLDLPEGSEVGNYNRSIMSMVQSMAAQGKHISTVDMFHAVSSRDLVDHVHPNANGYRHMASAWYKALAPILNVLEHR
ncbi:MAG: hypothetical protein J2P37_11750 [Ktedonobacteraceae bacterium]|nr:hypothetical protein [Ktedonobacteraceae bacterium]